MRPRPMSQQMAPLPNFRIPSDINQRPVPFEAVALDCAGPWFVKETSFAKPKKRYMLLFRCCMFGAIHIEKIDNMNTHSFLLAFQRFCGTYSVPNTIVCDQGSNIKSADKEIEHLWSQLDQVEIQKHNPRIEWIFNPAKVPHYTGLVERMIQSTKDSFKRTMPDPMTGEELDTVFKHTQMMLNNRPIGFKHNPDPDSLEALTPAHFLASGKICEDIAPSGEASRSI
jgi:hypothetical protein